MQTGITSGGGMLLGGAAAALGCVFWSAAVFLFLDIGRSLRHLKHRGGK
jgi:hypothetical protein